jgi:cell division protein FtsW
MVCLGITASVLYVAGMRFRYFVFGLVPVVMVLGYMIVFVPWRWARVIAFLHPDRDPRVSFQTYQSLIAVSTGGVTGLGLMEGKQKLFFLPEPHTDFIYSVASEELGMIGAVLIAVLFFVLAWRGFRAALRARDNFGRFLACGIATMIVAQAFFNMSVVLALVPNKGIPLPFISYGGSSLFVMLASMGVLLNITQQAE